MSKSLSNISLLNVLPPNFNKPKHKALAKAVDKVFKLYADNISKVVIMGDIKNLDESTLDILAAELMVNGYNSNLPKHIKLNLIKSNYLIWNKKGTPKAVEEIVTAIFGDGKVEEWFNYDEVGQPFNFRVHTSNVSANDSMVKEFETAVKNTQNIRSHLEKVVIETSTALNLNVGMYMQEAEIIEI